MLQRAIKREKKLKEEAGLSARLNRLQGDLVQRLENKVAELESELSSARQRAEDSEDLEETLLTAEMAALDQASSFRSQLLDAQLEKLALFKELQAAQASVADLQTSLTTVTKEYGRLAEKAAAQEQLLREQQLVLNDARVHKVAAPLLETLALPC